MKPVYAIREPAVAGLFYPGEAGELAAMVDRLLGEVEADQSLEPCALVIPHAGYIYSGAVAARAWALAAARRWQRVALLGPPHRMPVRAMAAPAAQQLATPLGLLTVDHAAVQDLAQHCEVEISDAPHAGEHSLEVHLPFIQRQLGQPLVVPLLVGEADPARVARVLERLDDGNTLLVVSSDLSHFLGYEEAVARDHATLRLAAEGSTRLTGEQACGCRALNGLNHYAAHRQWQIRQIAYANSGDTAGDRQRVVGYGALACMVAHPTDVAGERSAP